MTVEWLPIQIVKKFSQPTRHEKHAGVPQWISQMKIGRFGRLAASAVCPEAIPQRLTRRRDSAVRRRSR
jgi:hypothetical protein